MRIQIIRYNEGQEPHTVTEALKVAGYTRKQLQRELEGHGNNPFSLSTKIGDFGAPAGWLFGLEISL